MRVCLRFCCWNAFVHCGLRTTPHFVHGFTYYYLLPSWVACCLDHLLPPPDYCHPCGHHTPPHWFCRSTFARFAGWATPALFCLTWDVLTFVARTQPFAVACAHLPRRFTISLPVSPVRSTAPLPSTGRRAFYLPVIALHARFLHRFGYPCPVTAYRLFYAAVTALPLWFVIPRFCDPCAAGLPDPPDATPLPAVCCATFILPFVIPTGRVGWRWLLPFPVTLHIRLPRTRAWRWLVNCYRLFWRAVSEPPLSIMILNCHYRLCCERSVTHRPTAASL